MKPIYYVTGRCGSGKTDGMIRYIAHAAKTTGRNVLFVQPTKFLLEQTEARIAECHPGQQVTIIHGDNGEKDQSAVSRIMTFMKGQHRGVALGITHAAFFSIPRWDRRGDWDLIVDEVPAVDGVELINLPNTSTFVLDDFAVGQERGSYLSLKPAQGRLQHVKEVAANNEHDDIYAVLQKLYGRVVSENYETWVKRADWTQLTMPSLNNAERPSLICHWVLRPEVFGAWDNPTIMGANFKDSMLCQLWRGRADFQPHPHIKSEVDQYPEEVGRRLTLRYISERPNSQKLQHQAGDRFRQVINEAITTHWADEPFLWVANTAIKADFIEGPAGTRIKAICHGRNDCQDYTRIAFVAALNDHPAHFKFLDEVCGLSGDLVSQAKSQEIIHQAIMRTALRDRSSQAPVEAIVFEKAMALHLKDRLFPHARIEKPDQIDSLFVERNPVSRERIGTKPAMTQTERNRKSRETKKKFMQEQHHLISLLTGDSDLLWFDQDQTQAKCYDSGLYIKPEFVTSEVHASLVPSTKCTEFLSCQLGNWDEVRQVMRNAFDTHYKTKDDNFLMSGATFSPRSDTTTKRGLANVDYVSFMQLDFDGGDVGPVDLRSIFNDFAWLAYNTSSNDILEGQLRFRLFIPLRYPVTIEFYHRLWDLLAKRLEQSGFTVGKPILGRRHSGLDRSKRPASSLFYAPCQARKRGDINSFFDDQMWDEDRILDPMDPTWINAMDFSPEEQRVPLEFENLDALVARSARVGEQEIEETLEKVRQACVNAAPGAGSNTLFKQAVRMKQLGLSCLDIERRLCETAPGMRHPEERKAQIPSIMRSLKKAA